jgi:hypothetical protein
MIICNILIINNLYCLFNMRPGYFMRLVFDSTSRAVLLVIISPFFYDKTIC